MKLREELTKALVYAVEHYPAHGSYRGHLTEEEYNEIKKRGFEIDTMSIFKDGGADWLFRYSKGAK